MRDDTARLFASRAAPLLPYPAQFAGATKRLEARNEPAGDANAAAGGAYRGGSPLSTQPRPSRRTRPWSASFVSAPDTDGRRAATR